MNTVDLYTGTNIENGMNLINGRFNIISWWSDNYETIARYYEGRVIKITIRLCDDLQTEYIRSIDELSVDASEYTYGYAEMRIPKGATWYSFGASYLRDNIINIEEIEFCELKKMKRFNKWYKFMFKNIK